jgi:hypothetical protein
MRTRGLQPPSSGRGVCIGLPKSDTLVSYAIITHSGSLPEATHLGPFTDWKAVIVSSSARIVPCVTQYMHACRELLGTPLI